MKAHNFYLELKNLNRENTQLKFLITCEKKDILAESYQFSAKIAATAEGESVYKDNFIQEKVLKLLKIDKIKKIYVRDKMQKQQIEQFLTFCQPKVEIIDILEYINKKLDTKFSSFEAAFAELCNSINKGSMTAVYELKEFLENHKTPKPKVVISTKIDNSYQPTSPTIQPKIAVETLKIIENKPEKVENYTNYRWSSQPTTVPKREISNQEQGCWSELLEMIYTILIFLFVVALFSKC